jgi:AraC family transcriptional regulator
LTKLRFQIPYHESINNVLNHISAHLDGDLSLETLAGIAHFSPFHFHRIFKDVVGQTLNQVVNRARLEHAAKLMRSDPRLRALDAALRCGYESAAGFSRAFKKQYGLSPRQWDRRSPLQDRKIEQVDHGFPVYTMETLQEFAQNQRVRVERTGLPAQRLAYLRVTDS